MHKKILALLATAALAACSHADNNASQANSPAAPTQTSPAMATMAEGARFLEQTRTKPGVKTTASGLEYEVIREGQGEHPKATDFVTVNYRGTLINGTQFDSSYDRGQPASFPLDRVIPGWTEGLQLMTIGSRYKFYIPSPLAYGEQSPTPAIPPNSTLIFEVELLQIQHPGSTQ